MPSPLDAAIVAREYKKPTVVGTQVATKRLQDGDIVEVNAADGSVTLICHASIISNKLKKPCIVGTHFATGMFEDGDYIEVNADTGTIILLNKRDSAPEYKEELQWQDVFKTVLS